MQLRLESSIPNEAGEIELLTLGNVRSGIGSRTCYAVVEQFWVSEWKDPMVNPTSTY